jgi:hypothetical protein
MLGLDGVSPHRRWVGAKVAVQAVVVFQGPLGFVRPFNLKNILALPPVIRRNPTIEFKKNMNLEPAGRCRLRRYSMISGHF